MDDNYNLRIVFKNDRKLYHRTISFEHTKTLITESFPKNLVAYRALTNNPDIIISVPKYGCTILVNGEPELIFTDPVFAVRTIEEYLEEYRNDDFRFRIQKVGYSTTNKGGKISDYHEEFSIDLSADQAVSQNDEIHLNSFLSENKHSKHIDNPIDEANRNAIFTPEKSKEDNNSPKNKTKDAKTHDGIERETRFTEGDVIYGMKKLHLGVSSKYRVENNRGKRVIPGKNTEKNMNFKTLSEIRNDQNKFRKNHPVEKVVFEDEIKKELLTKITKDAESINLKYRRVKRISSLELNKEHIEENNIGEQAESNTPEKKTDDLFSKFLKDMLNESKLKIKKRNKQKRKERESDIIQLFKSVKGIKEEEEQNSEKDI